MAKYIRLTADEVATAAELAGVPPELAVAEWQQGGKRFAASAAEDPVENMQDGLAALAADTAEDEPDEPDDDTDDSAPDIPGYTGPVENNSMVPYAQDAEAMNTQGSDDYDLNQYIRKLVDEEFDSHA